MKKLTLTIPIKNRLHVCAVDLFIVKLNLLGNKKTNFFSNWRYKYFLDLTLSKITYLYLIYYKENVSGIFYLFLHALVVTPGVFCNKSLFL
jgi:hypothetical protein